MSAIGRCLPLTHGIAAARDVARGSIARRRLRARLDRGGIGVAYAVAGFVLFRFLEHASRRRAVLDTF